MPFYAVLQQTLYAACSLTTLSLFITSGTGRWELTGFWSCIISRHDPILRKEMSNNNNNVEKVFAIFMIFEKLYLENWILFKIRWRPEDQKFHFKLKFCCV